MSDAQESKAVLKNILHRTDWQYVSLGDLFVEESVIRFIPYGGFRSSAPIMSGAAALFGGLVGVVSNRLLDGTLSDAVPHAKKARILEWAMEPVRRADRHAVTIVVGRSNLKRLETEGGIAFETEAATEVFGYAFSEDAAAYGEVLKQWYSGSLDSHPSVAQHGIGIGRPVPLDFIESTLAGQPVPDPTSRAVTEFSEDTDYLRRFAEVFASYGREKRQQLLGAWQTMPEGFKRHLAAFMATKSEGADRAPILSVVFMLLGFSGIAYAVHGFLWISAHEDQLEKGSFAASGLKEIGIGFVSVFTAIFAVIAIAGWFGKRQYRSMLVSFAGPQGSFPVGETRPAVGAIPAEQRVHTQAPKSGVEPIHQAPSRRIVTGQVLAGLVTGFIFGGGGGLALHILGSLGSPKPGAEIRGASMALWAFAGAYVAGALLSGSQGWPSSAVRVVGRIGVLLGVGVALWGLGVGLLSMWGLYEFDGGAAGLAGVMGLVLGAFVYVWLHDRAPWLFPFLGDLKKRQDRELIKSLKDE